MSKGGVKAIRRRAEQGDTQAQVKLAFLLLTGRGVAKSIAEAVTWVQAACARGDPNAMVLHAVLAARGVGRTKSMDDAYNYTKQAAALGHPRAQDQLKVLGEFAFDRAPWNKPIELMKLADKPRVFCVKGLIPKHVCDWFIQVSSSKLKPAEIFNPAGGSMPDPARTNSVATLDLIEGDLVQQLVCRRLAIATGLPIDHQEPINILRYLPGEEYKPHYDFVRTWEAEGQAFAEELANIGQRVATALVYLNDGYDGGATVFPRINLSFKGDVGDALIFWNISEQGEPERDSLHAGAPVTNGAKWLLSQWIREKPLPWN